MGSQEDEPIAESFRAVARRLRQLSRETLAPHDVAPSHSRALGVLMRHGQMRLNELSEHLRIAPRSTTEVVDALEDRGLVDRRPDPTDRRATIVSLTDEGHRLSATIHAARHDDAEKFFGALSATDRAHLDRILRKLRSEEVKRGGYQP